MTTKRMSFDFFCTMTPVRLTISGKRGEAMLTRLLTLNVA